MAANRNDSGGTRELIREEASVAETTEYYTIKGKALWLDDNEQPRVDNLSNLCYAFRTGSRRELRVSDNGEYINPYGLPQRNKVGRFVPVTEACFNSYLRFLKTGVEKYYIQAKREM